MRQRVADAVERAKALRDGTPPERLEGIASDDLMKRVMRNDDYVRWGKDCL